MPNTMSDTLTRDLTRREMRAVKNKNKIKISGNDRVFYLISGLLVCLLIIVLLFPMLFILAASFSSAQAVNAGRVWIWPVDFTTKAYSFIFRNKDIMLGYRNSFFYAIVGTFINVTLTLFAAYPLSSKDMPFRKTLTFLFTFTMFFSGGMIPSYMLLTKLKMINTVWAMLIPGAISVYNVIITRTFFQSSIPEDIVDASKIDGCTEYRFFFSILLPLSKAIIAVITLYYLVGHWNAYFNAFLYLSRKELYPLQIFLRDILVMNDIQDLALDPDTMQARMDLAEQLKYALIIVSSVPVMLLYPFVKKFFVKGVMIGSIKG